MGRSTARRPRITGPSILIPSVLVAISVNYLHTEPVWTLEDFRAAASGLGHHPQDHGWRDLYRLFSYGLNRSAPNLTTLTLAEARARPALSATHLITLLGIALKIIASDSFDTIAIDGPMDVRLHALESILDRHRDLISTIVRTRQNSFTSVRRFLVPQVILSSYFSSLNGCQAVFADFGTGLGVLPRQLNSRHQYNTFANDLIWPDGIPTFRTIPLASRLGVDKGPLPDLDWVHACYGRSEYYTNLYDELLRALHTPDVSTTNVQYEKLDLLDIEALGAFIHQHKINAANFSYVLYELESGMRTKIVEALVRELHPPGVLIVAEPHRELQGQGTVVELFHNGDVTPRTLCFVSDGHYKGYVIPLDDYESFARSFPIIYEPKEVENSSNETSN
jgi:hypothetical protein